MGRTAASAVLVVAKVEENARRDQRPKEVPPQKPGVTANADTILSVCKSYSYVHVI